jgi:hypothetical protein
MKADIKPSWLTMSTPRLERHLLEKAYPTDLMRDIVANVTAAKEQRRRQRIKTTVTHQLWDNVLQAARIELAGLRTMKCQLATALKTTSGVLPPNAKYEAMCAYEDVLITTINKLRRVQKAGEHTPAQFVRYILKKTGRLIPNEGAHWSDYVGNKDKLNIEALFNALPDPARGKRKTPFERRVSPKEHASARTHLVGQLERAQIELDERYAMPSTPEGKQSLVELERDIQKANYVLAITKNTTPLPARWQGLLNM